MAQLKICLGNFERRMMILNLERTSYPMCPDLPKFCHFTSKLKNFGQFYRVQLVFGKFYMLLGNLSLLKMAK